MMSHAQMRLAVFEYIEVGQRRHSGPDYLGPENYEKNFFADEAGQAPPAGGAKGQASTSSATEEQVSRFKGLDPGQDGSRYLQRHTPPRPAPA